MYVLLVSLYVDMCKFNSFPDPFCCARYTEYQKVCQSDRKRRDRQRKQAQQAVRDMAAAVKIQAWWRGMLVRHKLGPFAGKKKGKGKKGKGKKKK